MSGKIKAKASWSLFQKFDANGNNVRKSSSIGKMTSDGGGQQQSSSSLVSSKITITTATTTTTTAKLDPSGLIKPKCKTVKSSSTSSIRPKTLNVNGPKESAMDEATIFIGEALCAWRAKARCNVVPAERVQDLFLELQFNPSEKQISEMLQTAKVFARKGSGHLNGLTFGEFCVLAADLKRFRTCSFANDTETTLSSLQQSIRPNVVNNTAIENSRNNLNNSDSKVTKTEIETTTALTADQSTNKNSSSSVNNITSSSTTKLTITPTSTSTSTSESQLPNSSKSTSTSSTSQSDNSTDKTRKISDTNGPEVFLGGSCNPTTWRADVAIPALRELGISFYNPQVSDWTPDLIELEHRAKEKARVLFFVIDSETRASAGSIEAAHIAGQNSKQLVLVLHPYKQSQTILSEPISQQEFVDLSRNQQILKELVTRRGLPVLDNIPSGLQRTKQIVAGIRDPPMNIASILIVVRGAYDRVINSLADDITIQQCQRALSYLGYAQSLLSVENLKKIILSQRESLGSFSRNSNITKRAISPKKGELQINFEEFCILAAYLSVLQQEIHESGCISPIKGINLPPPPIFLANMREGFHRSGEEIINVNDTTQIYRTSSCTSVPDDRHSDISRNRDSGTSSPQPTEFLKTKSNHIGKRSKISLNAELAAIANSGDTNAEEESDSNDSVFSSGSSINSINYNFDPPFSASEFRDVYLGGSCYLRTKWRQESAIPYLNSKCVTFHLPALHESILPSQLNLNGNTETTNVDEATSIAASSTLLKRTRRKESLVTALNKQSSTEDGDEVELRRKNDASDDMPNRPLSIRPNLYNPTLLDSSRVLLFVITNETRSLAPMTLAAHCIGLMYNVILCVQMLPEFCIIGNEKLTATAIKDYNRGRSYLIDLAKRQGVPVFNDLKSALECTVEKVKACNSRNSV